MNNTTPEEMAERIGTDAAALVLVLEDATSVQWDRGRSVDLKEDAGIKGQGSISRPTEDITLDERRIAVREAVLAGTRTLVKAFYELERSVAQTTRALEAWKEDPENFA